MRERVGDSEESEREGKREREREGEIERGGDKTKTKILFKIFTVCRSMLY